MITQTKHSCYSLYESDKNKKPFLSMSQRLCWNVFHLKLQPLTAAGCFCAFESTFPYKLLLADILWHMVSHKEELKLRRPNFKTSFHFLIIQCSSSSLFN